MLLLLLCLLPATGSSETSPGILFKPSNQSCPETGYFFERGNGSEPAPCYLCFCQGDSHAVCSLRPGTRCDERLYTHQKRNTSRVRRNPEWTDTLRDTTRNVLNTNPEQHQCKQNSSKSIGCPPDDWCKGCMVCDCNANGIWECHLMTFCDKKSKKPKKAPKSNKTPFNTQYVKNYSVKNESTYNNGKNVNKKPPGKRKVKKYMNNSNFIPQISVETKKAFVRNDQKEKSLVIKRYISTIRPIKSPDLLKYKNNPSKLAQLLYRQYISNMRKAPNKIKKRMITDKYYGAKTAKGILKKNRKPNKMKSEKPMNTNKNKHMNMEKVMRNNYKDDNKKQLKRTPAFKSQKYMASTYKTSKRAKRDVSFATDIPKNVTDFQGVESANGSGHTHQFTNGTEVSFTTSEDIHTKLNNYAYTVDNLVTTSMKNNHPNVSQHDTTEMQENNGDKTKDHITIEDMTLEDTTTHPITEKMLIEHTTNRGLKLITVYNDILKKTQLMNDQNYEQNVKIQNATNTFVNNQSEISNKNMKIKVSAQDIKKMALAKKKFNLKKLIRTLHSRIRNTKNIGNFMNKSLIDNNSTRVKINGTLNDIQRLLEKMLHDATKNKKTNERLKTKSFAAIKYLKKLFAKLFSRSKNKTAVEKVAVLNSICETFGPCRISNKKMKIIHLKVKELISETLKALNSIKIIKGLLQLLYVHSDKKENATSKEPDFKIHLKQLNAILKEQYPPEINWTHTQIIQMNLIKSNTQVFIKSIGKFSTILNDIIIIIKSENEQLNLKRYEMIKNKRLNETDVLSKMKRLLIKYNLIQNSFLHKIYAALTNVEERFKNRRAEGFQYKNESENNTNYRIIIEKYVDNINENLKKLKELAARMDSRTRRKRDARDDNAVDYLLTLMEYLLKRNNPIDTPPVNDGIDLIIEAIRRAPDIRPIQKSVLQYVPITAASPANSAVSREESDSKSKDNSTEDLKKSEDSADNDIQFDDRKKNSKHGVASTTKRIQSLIELSDVITEPPSKVYMASFNPYENTEKADNDTASKIDTRRDEEADPLNVDDDNLKIIKKAEIDLELGIDLRSTTVPIFKDQKEEELKMRHYIPINEKYSTKEPKTKLDLINEAYEQEIKQQNEKKEQTTVKPVVTRVKGETGKRERKVGSADISCITKEIVDEEKSLSPSQIDTEKVFHRKQMDLLNSLDYGTDKSLMDDSDSRDSSPVDRLNNEAFPSY